MGFDGWTSPAISKQGAGYQAPKDTVLIAPFVAMTPACSLTIVLQASPKGSYLTPENCAYNRNPG